MHIKKASPLGINIATDKYNSIKSGIIKEADEYDDASLLGGESLALEPEGDYIWV